MYFVNFCFGGEVGFLNCDDICTCVVNTQFELLEFVFNSVYVDLKYNEISLTFTAGYVCLCVVCSHVVVLGLRECECDGNAGVRNRGRCGCSECGEWLCGWYTWFKYCV